MDIKDVSDWAARKTDEGPALPGGGDAGGEGDGGAGDPKADLLAEVDELVSIADRMGDDPETADKVRAIADELKAIAEGEGGGDESDDSEDDEDDGDEDVTDDLA